MKNYLWLLFMVLNYSLIAQNWEQLPMHGGGYVTGLIPHTTDANTLYARIDVAGVYKTINGGDNWTSITSSIPKSNNYHYYVRSFAIDKQQSQNLFFASGNAPYESGNITEEWFLWKTTNDGTSWSKIVSPIAIGGNGQYRNAGETLMIHPTNSDIVYLSGQPTYDWGTLDWKSNSGLYQYQISTDTWTQLDGGILAKAWTTNLKINPDNSDILYLSATENSQFGVASTGVGLWKYVISTGMLTQVYNDEVFEFDFDINGADSIVIVAPHGINWTFDGGQNWEGLVQPFGYGYNYFITTHPTNSGQWFFGYWDNFNSSGIIETTDFGTTFQETKYNGGSNQLKVSHPTYAANNHQPNFGNATATLLFHPANLNHVYTSDWYGIFKSENGNQNLINNSASANTENSNWSWTWKTEGIYNLVQFRVTKHPTQNDKFYNCIADIGFYEGNSSLNTMNYQTIHPITSVYKINYSIDNSSTGYMIGKHHSNKGRILKTTDSGVNWFEVNSNFIWGTSYFEANNSTAVTDLQIAKGNGDTLVVGIDKGNMSNQIYLSTDGGTSYSTWETGIATSNIFKSWTSLDKLLLDADGETFYIWHQSELFKRHISEAQWTLMTNPTITGWFAQVITHPTIPNTLFATQYGNIIYKSIDNGSTWTNITTDANRSMEIAVSDNGTIAVIDGFHENTNKIQSLFISDNNGTSWSEIGMNNHPTIVSGILFLNDFKLIGWSKNTGSAILDLSPVLPVDLLNFEANCNGNDVSFNWTTTNEIQLDEFELEQKSDLTDWETIANITAKGTVATIENYRFNYSHSVFGTKYFRLKMSDFDGHYKYSNSVPVFCQKKSIIKLFPNPTNNIIVIKNLNTNLQKLDYQIVNSIGQIVLKQFNIQVQSEIEIDISNLPNGIYYLQLNEEFSKDKFTFLKF